MSLNIESLFYPPERNELKSSASKKAFTLYTRFALPVKNFYLTHKLGCKIVIAALYFIIGTVTMMSLEGWTSIERCYVALICYI